MLGAMAPPALADDHVPTATEVLSSLPERGDEVSLRGNPVTLLGTPAKVGEAAPDFVAVAQDMSEKTLSDYEGKVVVLAAVPSLNTGVCSLQTKTFNEKASALGDDVAVVTVSMDLPFAQKRWCGAEGVERVETLSDYRHWSVGLAYGLKIEENGLLARSVHVIGPDGKLVYRQIVPELTEEPDYDAALAAVRELTAK
jgi:thiol peroxidase